MLEDGLAVIFQSAAGGAADHTVRPHFMLYVPEGRAASPFISPGPFTAKWEGVVHLDLRDRFIFQAELNGSLKLELNDKLVMEETGTGGLTEPTKRIRLNSRSNTLKATFKAPEKGDAFFRLYWSTPDYGNEPIPPKYLKHTPDEKLAEGSALRRGRQLAAEHRCFNCHATDAPGKGMPELAMDAPAFEGIGSRRGTDWMADWVRNPKKMRPSAKMPAMLHGVTAEADARAIAAARFDERALVSPGAKIKRVVVATPTGAYEAAIVQVAPSPEQLEVLEVVVDLSAGTIASLRPTTQR